ncbi:TetR/AcrR family transcriptional regulator C-terminal domain-containing protein [Nonomuraea sp. NPDC003201]
MVRGLIPLRPCARRGGLQRSEALRVITTVATFVSGQVSAEAGRIPSLGLDPARHPVLVRAIAAGFGTSDDHQDRFDSALEALPAGLGPRRDQ